MINKLNDYIRQAYQTACEKGFHEDIGPEHFDQLICLIISEIGEMIEAHRNGFFCDKVLFDQMCFYFYERPNDKDWNFKHKFETTIKDKFEDELADIFIRLFDLWGWLDLGVMLLEIRKDWEKYIKTSTKNIFSYFQYIIMCLLGIFCNSSTYRKQSSLLSIINQLYVFAQSRDIDIEKFIEMKMAYNKTRERKHGKKY